MTFGYSLVYHRFGYAGGNGRARLVAIEDNLKLGGLGVLLPNSEQSLGGSTALQDNDVAATIRDCACCGLAPALEGVAFAQGNCGGDCEVVDGFSAGICLSAGNIAYAGAVTIIHQAIVVGGALSAAVHVVVAAVCGDEVIDRHAVVDGGEYRLGVIGIGGVATVAVVEGEGVDVAFALLPINRNGDGGVAIVEQLVGGGVEFAAGYVVYFALDKKVCTVEVAALILGIPSLNALRNKGQHVGEAVLVVDFGSGEVADVAAEGNRVERYIVALEFAQLGIGPCALTGKTYVMLNVVVVGILPVLVGAYSLWESEGAAIADMSHGYAANLYMDVGVGAASLESYLTECVTEVEVDGVGGLGLIELLSVDKVYLLGNVVFDCKVVEAGTTVVEVKFLVTVYLCEEVEVIFGPVAGAGLVDPFDGIASFVDDEVAAEISAAVIGVLSPPLEGARQRVVTVGIGSAGAAGGGYAKRDALLLLVHHLVLRAGGEQQG